MINLVRAYSGIYNVTNTYDKNGKYQVLMSQTMGGLIFLLCWLNKRKEIL